MDRVYIWNVNLKPGSMNDLEYLVSVQYKILLRRSKIHIGRV